VLQTITSIQEQTLSFVPKLLGCGLCLWTMAPWILQQLGSLFEIMLTKAGTFTP
jgi:flagellar biosynthesis protein FliQ